MDAWLVQAARARATGATAHAVAGLCQQLLNSASMARRGDADAAMEAAVVRRVLRALIRTGRLPPAARRVPVRSAFWEDALETP